MAGGGSPGLHAKKKTIVALERDRPHIAIERANFIAQAQGLRPEQLVFLDETGTHIGMNRDRARAARGQRIHGRVPRNRGPILTVLAALRLDGIFATRTFKGGTSGQVFKDYVQEDLAPGLRKGDIVVMDNLGAHHAKGVRELIEAAGAQVLYLPAYSPDLNPIEACWSKLKHILKGMGARTHAKLAEAVQTAKRRISRSDIIGWFGYAGFSNQPD